MARQSWRSSSSNYMKAEGWSGILEILIKLLFVLFWILKADVFVFLVKPNNVKWGGAGGRADSVSDTIVSVVLQWVCFCEVCFQYKSLFKQWKHLSWPREKPLILLDVTDIQLWLTKLRILFGICYHRDLCTSKDLITFSKTLDTVQSLLAVNTCTERYLNQRRWTGFT